MGAVEVQSLGYFTLAFVSSDSVPVDAKSTSFVKEMFFKGSFLYFGEGTGHGNRVGTPPDTT